MSWRARAATLCGLRRSKQPEASAENIKHFGFVLPKCTTNSCARNYCDLRMRRVPCGGPAIAIIRSTTNQRAKG
jgi:hypothetical protein